MYFERKSYDEDSGIMKVQWFEDYDMINGEWRGIIKIDGEMQYRQTEDGKAQQVIMN